MGGVREDNNMSEVILFLVIVALGSLIAWDRHENRKERQKLIQAIMSKSAADMVNFEMADKVEKITPNQPLINPDDYTAESELSDKEFDKYVLNKEEDNG